MYHPEKKIHKMNMNREMHIAVLKLSLRFKALPRFYVCLCLLVCVYLCIWMSLCTY